MLRNGSFPEYFPDGEHIAFVSQTTMDPVRGHFGGRRIAIASVDDPHSRRTLVRSNGLIWWPAMSPDGSRIAYQADGAIYVLDVATGDSSPVAFGELADWFDDDTLIVNPG